MHLLAPDLLAEAAGLSPAVSGSGLLIGVAVWLTGWRLHQFWLVVFATLTAGVIGLHTGRALGVQILVAGLLLASAAGFLAVELARLSAFVAGGAAASWAVALVVPGTAEPAVGFLVGGLLGVLLFRLWVMVLTSVVGSVLGSFALLALCGRVCRWSVAEWVEGRELWCNSAVLLLTSAGVASQAYVEHWWTQRSKPTEKTAADEKE
jgi:hypothetical protein